MTEKSYNWRMMSDTALVEMIGAFVKHHRLAQNKSQQELADDAGISRSTLALLEKGEKITMGSFLKVLRALDQLHILESFKIIETISPLALAKQEKEKRRRASKTKISQPKSDSEW